jgi:hypothetical protein
MFHRIISIKSATVRFGGASKLSFIFISRIIRQMLSYL